MQRIGLMSLFALLMVLAVPVLGQDDIPDNCETATSDDSRNLFPRFEARHTRLVLVDWRTGDTVRVIAEGINGYRIRSWSPDCRYLATAEGDWRVTETVVYDVENSVRMGSVPDAAAKLHPLTWGPNGYLMVESRHGAVLWHVPSGRQTILTDSFNYTRVRNFVQIVWDVSNNQVLVTLAMGGRAAFDLGTGAEIPLTEAAHALLDAGEIDRLSSTAINNSLILATLLISDSFTGNPNNIQIGMSVPIVAEIINLTDSDLTGETTAIIDVPTIFEITEIRIDPAQDYTNIADAVNSVRDDGGVLTVTLHDPNRPLTIERIVDEQGETMTRLTWVFTETVPAAEGASLRIDFVVTAIARGVFSLNFTARQIAEVESP